jgi:hypothetical protein
MVVGFSLGTMAIALLRALAQDFGFINIGLKPEFDGIPLTPG